MKDIQRYLIIGAIAVLSYMLLTEWVHFRQGAESTSKTPAQTAAQPSTLPTDVETSNSNDEVPVSAEFHAPTAEQAVATELVQVSTDVLDVKINPEGGDIVYAALKQHYADIDNPDQPFVLLENNDERRYVAQSGLVGRNATDTPKGRPLFTVTSDSYLLADGQQTLDVDLHYAVSNDISLIKRYRFTRGQYLIKMQYLVDNRSDKPWQASLFTQLKRDNSSDPSLTKGMSMKPFLGVAYRTPDDPFEKLKFDAMKDKPLNLSMTGGWIAIVQHYFLSAWVPDVQAQNQFTTLVTRGGDNIARVTSENVTVGPGEQGEINAQLYVGPKDQYVLDDISAGLELSVDYGWLWWIAQPLFWLLNKIHSLIGNWGWSIVLVTVLVKAIFFRLNATAFRSMANMRRVQPKLVDLRERYADDRQKQSQAMMELYKKEKINPLGGCLPMLVQMPVFISLYWVLMESVELRHAPFFGYIKDLSVMDPYYILPAIMGLSMFVQQKLNPPPPDPMQAKVMQWLPVIFTFFFLFFPAGLVLYWVVNNTLSIIQQYVITRSLEKSTAKAG